MTKITLLIISMFICILNAATAMEYDEPSVFFYHASRTPQNLDEEEILSSNTKIVLQQEAFILRKNDKRYMAGTFGIGPCVAVALYNSNSHTGVLAHLDSLQLSTTTTSNITPLHVNIKDLISKVCIEENKIDECTGAIYSRCSYLLDNIEEYIKKYFPKLLCKTEVGDEGGIVLNAKTGMIYHPDPGVLQSIYLKNGMPPLAAISIDRLIKWVE